MASLRLSEHQEQSIVVATFKAKYRKYAGCIMAIPNGSWLAGNPKQRAMQINKLKREGLKKGVSDLFIAVPAGGKCGLWIEMKRSGATKSSVSDEQRDHIELMIDMGYAAEWAAGADEAMDIIKKYMDPAPAG